MRSTSRRAALAIAATLSLVLLPALPAAALDDATQTAALGRLDIYLQTHATDFGALWWDRSKGEAVVQVTERVDEAERAELVALAEPVPVRFDTVANSRAEIEAAQRAIIRLLRRDDPRVEGLRGFGVELSDLQAGRHVLAVKVAPARLEAVRAYLVERWGEDLFRFEAGGLDQNAAEPAATAEPATADPAAELVAAIRELTAAVAALTEVLRAMVEQPAG